MWELHAIKIQLLGAYNVPETAGDKKTSNIWDLGEGRGSRPTEGDGHTLKNYTPMGQVSEGSKGKVLLEHKGSD